MASQNSVNNKPSGAFSLPTTTGSNNQVLTSDGAGSSSWTTPSGGFINPGAIANIFAWYKADTGTYQDTGLSIPATANNDPVGGWQDQSGNANHMLQSTAGNRPLLKTNILNSLPGIRWDAVDDSLSAGNVLASATTLTIFVVSNTTNTGSEMLAQYNGTSGLLVSGTTGAAAWQILTNGSNYNVANLGNDVQVNGRNTLLTMRVGPSIDKDIQTRLFGSSRGTSLTTAGTFTGYSGLASTLDLGTRGGGFWGGDIFELIIYTRGLGVYEVQQVEAYLSNKWAV